jgi:limonene-1,2-epoxide hydrolase
MTQNKSQFSESNAKETVLKFITALNKEDIDTAKKYANENLSFIGVLGSRNGAKDYFNDMERIKIKYDIKKAFVDGDDVCILCDYIINNITVFGCGWYHLENGKISSLKAVFDPRPILENGNKK